MKSLLPVFIVMSICGSAVAQVASPTITTSPTVSPVITTVPTATSNSSAQGGTGQGGTAGATANPASTASSGSSTVTFQTGNNSPFVNAIPSDQIIRSAPTVYVPSVATGNVCALGASAGGSWIAASIAFGMSWESMQCERRQAAALLWNMNTPESRAAAKEVICNTPEIRAAYAVIGSPCARDLMQVTGPVKPQQPIAPQQVTPVASFNAAQYRKASDCLTVAQAQGASLSLCAGKE